MFEWDQKLKSHFFLKSCLALSVNSGRNIGSEKEHTHSKCREHFQPQHFVVQQITF